LTGNPVRRCTAGVTPVEEVAVTEGYRLDEGAPLDDFFALQAARVHVVSLY